MSSYEQERDEVPEEWLDAWTGLTPLERRVADVQTRLQVAFGSDAPTVLPRMVGRRSA